MSHRLADVLKLEDFEYAAREVLPPAVFAYYSGGSGDEVTLKDNVEAFRRHRLRTRVFRDVSSIDCSTTFLGNHTPLPVGLAPTAQHGLAHPDGEIATARAAAEAGVVMCLSTLANRSLEEVASVGRASRWFQLYVHKDRGISRELIARAESAGYDAIVVTADFPYPGYRERELREPIRYGDQIVFGNFAEAMQGEGLTLTALLDQVVDNAVTWVDLDWVFETSRIPVLVKGILTAEDAKIAIDHGVAGIVVSNHGGRQLDRVPASIDVLEEVVDSVAGRAEIFLDGGIRRGTDVLVALALGARGVFIGRPYLYALALAGEAGILRALQLLREEVVNALGLIGATRVEELSRAHVV